MSIFSVDFDDRKKAKIEDLSLWFWISELKVQNSEKHITNSVDPLFDIFTRSSRTKWVRFLSIVLSSKRPNLRIWACDFEFQIETFNTVKNTLIIVWARCLMYLSALHKLNHMNSLSFNFEVKKYQNWVSELVILKLQIEASKQRKTHYELCGPAFIVYLSAHNLWGKKKLRIWACDFESQNWSFKTVKIILLMVWVRCWNIFIRSSSGQWFWFESMRSQPPVARNHFKRKSQSNWPVSLTHENRPFPT